MIPENDKSADDESAELENEIKVIRQKYYAQLAQQHALSAKEIQEIHESTLEKLASIEPKFQMYIEIALPKAIEEYKKGNSLDFRKVTQKKTLKVCPACGNEEGIREIIWGMPAGEPDESRFYVGGCTSEDFSVKYKCIRCGWEGKKLKRKAV